MWEHVIESSRAVSLRNWRERRKIVMKIKIVREDKK